MLINLKPRRSYINLTGVKNCRGNDFILSSETIAKDIALNKWLRTVMLINLKPRRSYINLTGVKNCPGIY